MAERSFVREVQDLRLGDGDEFRGEGILAITKALLQAGVSYVGGYQGAPISHLMDVLADAKDVLDELGVHFENSASEAAAAAMLSASVHYPIRERSRSSRPWVSMSPPMRLPISPRAESLAARSSLSARITERAPRSCRSAPTPMP